MNFEQHKSELLENGFTVIGAVYSESEINNIVQVINHTDTSKDTFRKSTDVFAIRQFLKEVPETVPLIFNDKVRGIVNTLFGKSYFVVKSIYFDKPEHSNWYVSYHQDLTISVDKKLELEGFGPWTVKHKQFAVQPPLDILENIFTLRIHLDDTNEENGALKVIPGSHLNGIYRPETIDWSKETEQVCEVLKAAVMIMKPLLLHSSGRTINQKRRRVIHIEFSDMALPQELSWSEKIDSGSLSI